MKTVNETFEKNFVGYEYQSVTVSRDLENLYSDGYRNFGWSLEGASGNRMGVLSVTMKFKRDRRIRNKAELTRLQRQFDACITEICGMEKSKFSSASMVAFSIGVAGCAFLAGATFAFLASMIPLCIILAIPGFVGWILPYFCYNNTFAKKSRSLAPLIDGKFDEIYEICEKANGLSGA